MRRYEMADVRLGRYTQTHYYVFDGGCIRYQFDLPADADQGASVLASQVVLALDFEKRDDIANRYFKATGLHLLDVD